MDNSLRQAYKINGQIKRTPQIVPFISVPERIKTFPTTRYYGSKRKLIGWIFENIKNLTFETVLDGFGGTASVSLLFKSMGKCVTYHDAFNFNTFTANAVLSNKMHLNKTKFENTLQSVELIDGVINKYFKNVFYTNSENMWLDGFMNKLDADSLAINQKSIYLYALFQACLQKRPFNLFHRANLSLRLTKHVERNFGNMTTWERGFPELMLRAYDELAHCVWNTGGKYKVIPSTDILNIEPEYDLVYLDPPYINKSASRNRDDYWMKYHFLEGLANYNEWEQKIDLASDIKITPKSPEFELWNQASSFKECLFELIEKHSKSIVVLSYVSDAYPDEKELLQFFVSKFHSVSFHSRLHSHALAKQTKRELMFIGIPA
ncbi:MAG: DNA adenine methylase [Candidatus Poribacteria bacterium]|nr:DNA adenine methylase [Candidatus Poribacteria bacterium]